MLVRWRCAAGVRLQVLGRGWAAFSGLSGETVLLNDEAAAVLEVLLESPSMSVAQLCAALENDADAGPAELQALVVSTLPGLLEAGLVQPE